MKFPFINGFYNNIYTVKYYIPYLSVLDKETRIQNLVKNLRWSFLQKLIIFVKSSILGIGLGSEYASADSNPLLIFQKNGAADLFDS